MSKRAADCSGPREAPQRQAGAEVAGRALRGLALALALALAPALPAGAQAHDQEIFLLLPQVRELLEGFQSGWLDWLTACNRGSAEEAAEAVDRLLARAALLEVERLPDLSVAAAAQAVTLSRGGEVRGPGCGLVSAERFDPGRPETAFAAATMARAAGGPLSGTGDLLKGYARALGLRSERRVMLSDLALWLLLALSAAGLAFITLELMIRGPGLYRDLAVFLERYAPRPVARLLAVLLLVWPFALPAGVLWAALYWSILLWRYGGRMERVLLFAVWLVLGASPLLLGEIERGLEVERFPPLRAIESLAGGRLEGDLFYQLGVLEASLPESGAVKQLLADVHRKLGQWQIARGLYREVLELEPENSSAQLDLGAYYFQAADFEQALEHFRTVAESGEPNAAALYNLSLTYSELYRFDDSERSLLLARGVDGEAVNEWIHDSGPLRVVASDGGLERVGEIRRQLAEAWRGGEAERSGVALWRRAVTLPLAALVLIVAVAVRLILGPVRVGGGEVSAGRWRGTAEPLRRVLVPGLRAAEEGRWGRAAGSLLLVTALLALPASRPLAFPVPWGFEPGPLPWAWIAGIGLALYFGLSFWAELRRGGS